MDNGVLCVMMALGYLMVKLSADNLALKVFR